MSEKTTDQAPEPTAEEEPTGENPITEASDNHSIAFNEDPDSDQKDSKGEEARGAGEQTGFVSPGSRLKALLARSAHHQGSQYKTDIETSQTSEAGTTSTKSPKIRRWRDWLIPRTVLGITSMILAFSIGASLSGVSLYFYYEYKL